MLEDSRILLAAFNSMRDGVVITDTSTIRNEIVYVNSAFLRMTGFQEAEILGQGTRFLLGSRTRPTAVQTFRKAIREKLACQVIFSTNRKDDTQVWLEITGAPIFLEGERTKYYVGTCRDVSARVEAVEQLIGTEIALEEKSPSSQEDGAIDSLTSLYSRHYFEEYAEREWLMMARKQLPVTLMMLGVQHLETMEGQCADGVSRNTLLEAVAKGLHGVLRRGTDLLARYDDDRFVAISSGMGWDDAETIAEKVVAQVDRTLRQTTGAEHLRCRLGIAISIPDEQKDLDALIRVAEAALEQAMNDTEHAWIIRAC